MLLWVKPGTAPSYAVMAEMPRGHDNTNDARVPLSELRRHKEDALVVPYNLEKALLWGAAHNVQKVSRHGFEMYLAKYISKPSLGIQLPENASVIGSVEALEVPMGFHQYQMTR